MKLPWWHSHTSLNHMSRALLFVEKLLPGLKPFPAEHGERLPSSSQKSIVSRGHRKQLRSLATWRIEKIWGTEELVGNVHDNRVNKELPIKRIIKKQVASFLE